MTHYLPSQSAPAFAGRRFIAWRAFVGGVLEIVQTWLTRRQQRQELLDYMANDHRAIADLRVSRNDARDWAERPFWQE